VSGQGVQIIDVRKDFGDHTALHGINLTISPGEFISLLGPSGCGKTTLLRIISGFEHPTSGKVLINEADVTTLPPHRRTTNIVFQRGALFPHMNVAANIGYSLKLLGWSRDKISARVEEMLALVKLEGLGHRGSTELSGGQVQRVALARALASEPSVLLLDEPLSALDLKLRQHMQLELRMIQRKLGATFIYVTHDQTEALVMSDRIAVMNEGRIEQEGTPREIYANPASIFASDFIGETNLIQGTVSRVEDGMVQIDVGDGSTIFGRGVGVRLGERATLSVRPESIRLRSPRVEVDNPQEEFDSCIVGLIREVIFLGSYTRVEIEVTDGLVILADLLDENSRGLVIGKQVQLLWPQGAATVWPTNIEREKA
jgi:spermidine/putrescine transport system ATP-binding protein